MRGLGFGDYRLCVIIWLCASYAVGFVVCVVVLWVLVLLWCVWFGFGFVVLITVSVFGFESLLIVLVYLRLCIVLFTCFVKAVCWMPVCGCGG